MEIPRPGFYKAALINNWKIFADYQNITPLAFIASLVCFRFFLAHIDFSFTMGHFRVLLPFGLIVVIITWGCQLWYYMENVYSASLNAKELADTKIGLGLDFFWNIIKSIYLFIVAMILAELPFLIIVVILKKIGLEQPYILQFITLGGAFLFPTIIYILSGGWDLWLVFRIDYLIKPFVKAPIAYLVVVAFVILAAKFEWETVGYNAVREQPRNLIALHLSANIATAGFTLIAMRAIGFFAYYYQCYMPK